MKRVLPVSVLLLASCATQSTVPLEKRLRFRELSPSEKLHVNTASEHYFTRKTREEGEKELVILASESETEEAWLFSKSTNTWYEMGFAEAEGHVSSEPVVKEFTGANWVHYHIHPGKQRRDKLIADLAPYTKDLPALLNPKLTSEQKEIIIEHLTVAYASALINFYCNTLPSAQDIADLVNRGLSSTHAVASKAGIVEYSIFCEDPKEAHKLLMEYEKFSDKAVQERLCKKYSAATDVVNDVVLAVNEEFKGKIKLAYRKAD